MVAVLQTAKASDPVLAKKIIPGRVHPAPAGHLIMTEQLLKAWNASPVVSIVAIDATGKNVTTQQNTAVSNLKVTTSVTWSQADNALPFPINIADPTIALVAKSSDLIQALDQETLTVTGLTAPSYALKIDNQVVGTFTKDELAAGVNLATLPTPMAAQAIKVAGLVNQQIGTHSLKWRAIDVALAGDPNPDVKQAVAQLDKALDAEEHGDVTQIRDTAQPVPHAFDLSPADAAASPAAPGQPATTRP